MLKYLFDIPSPTYLLVSHQPLTISNWRDTNIERISTEQEIGQWFGNKNFLYKEDIIYLLDTYQSPAISEQRAREINQAVVTKVLERMQNPLNHSLVVAKIDEMVGYGVFTTESILPGTIVCIYGGQSLADGRAAFPPEANNFIQGEFKTQYIQRIKSEDYEMGHSKINAGLIGGISRFIQHMPFHQKSLLDKIHGASYEECIEIYKVFVEPITNIIETGMSLEELKFFLITHWQEKFTKLIDLKTEEILNGPNGSLIATANLITKDILYKNMLVKVLIANRLINPGEQIGYDYELDYWKNRSISPSFFHKERGIVYNSPLQVLASSPHLFSAPSKKALELYNEGVELYNSYKSENNLASLEEAIALLEQSNALFENIENDTKQSVCLSTLASCHRDKGDIATALALCELANIKDPTNNNVIKKLKAMKKSQKISLKT